MEKVDDLIDVINAQPGVEILSAIGIPVGEEGHQRKVWLAHAIIGGAEYMINITPTDLGE